MPIDGDFIDVAAIARALGMVICEVDHDPNRALREHAAVSGALDFATGTIYVVAWESPERIRYTIAHEIGHEVLGHEALVGVVEQRERIEAEAEEFASELLMPSGRLAQALDELPDVPVPLLAHRFGVSVRAMERRVEAYLPPVTVVDLA